SRDGVVFDLAGARVGAEVDVRGAQLRRRDRRARSCDAALVAKNDSVDAEVAARLEIVLVAELMKLVVAGDDRVVSGRFRAEEVRAFAQVLLVVALLGGAGRAAERRRPHP